MSSLRALVGEAERRAEERRKRVLARVPAGGMRDDRVEPLGPDRHERRSARREHPLVGVGGDDVERRRVERQPADGLRRVDDRHHVVPAAAAAIASRSATSPVAICTALNATTSTSGPISPASSAAGTRRTRHAAVLLGHEREEDGRELDVRARARASRRRPTPRPSRAASRRWPPIATVSTGTPTSRANDPRASSAGDSPVLPARPSVRASPRARPAARPRPASGGSPYDAVLRYVPGGLQQRLRRRRRPSGQSDGPELDSRSWRRRCSETLWGGETDKAIENFPVSGEPIPTPGRALARAHQGRRRARERRPRTARSRPRRPHRRRGRPHRGRRVRRPVPDRRLPDGFGDELEHERERGDRDARGRRRPPERPREHGPVVERRLPVRRAPRGARRARERPPARARDARRARSSGRPPSSTTS